MAPDAIQADSESTAAAALDRAPIFDGHNDLAIHYARTEPRWSLERLDIATALPGQSDLPRMRQGQVGGALVTVSSGLDTTAKRHFPALLASFDWFDRLVAANPGRLIHARTASDLREARDAGRIAFMMAIEGGDQIDGSLDNLRAAHARGVRSMTIVYDHHNVIGDGAMAFPSSIEAAGPAAGGLTCFGREVVAEMNRLGLIVDLSHAAGTTARDAMAASAAPVLFSHSGARALADSPRNLEEVTLVDLRNNGGMVMVPLAPYLTTHESWRWFMAGEANFARLKRIYGSDKERISREAAAWDAANPPPPVSIAHVADQIEHIASRIGRDRVGIGSDFDGIGGFVIPDLADVTALPDLFTELARRGWSRPELEGLSSRNFERLLRSVEAASRKLRTGSSTPARTRPC